MVGGVKGDLVELFTDSNQPVYQHTPERGLQEGLVRLQM